VGTLAYQGEPAGLNGVGAKHPAAHVVPWVQRLLVLRQKKSRRFAMSWEGLMESAAFMACRSRSDGRLTLTIAVRSVSYIVIGGTSM
jgi:acyl-homoserine lactone acylase PvdQ